MRLTSVAVNSAAHRKFPGHCVPGDRRGSGESREFSSQPLATVLERLVEAGIRLYRDSPFQHLAQRCASGAARRDEAVVGRKIHSHCQSRCKVALRLRSTLLFFLRNQITFSEICGSPVRLSSPITGVQPNPLTPLPFILPLERITAQWCRNLCATRRALRCAPKLISTTLS